MLDSLFQTISHNVDSVESPSRSVGRDLALFEPSLRIKELRHHREMRFGSFSFEKARLKSTTDKNPCRVQLPLIFQ